jgi:hypothetical protein
VREWIDYAKKNPGKLNYASSGNGTIVQLTAELFKAQAGVFLTHIPYKGTALAIPDLVSGKVDVLFDSLPTGMPHVRDGRLRALGVTSLKRSPLAPELPAIADTLPGYESNTWFGFYGPKNLPADIVARVNTAANEALADPEVKEKLARLGIEPARPGTPDQFAKMVAVDAGKWQKIMSSSARSPTNKQELADMNFDFNNPYPPRASRVRAQRGVHLAPAGGAGRPAHAAAGRQCGRRGHRHGRGHDALRAGEQRPGQRRLLHPVGRQAAARPERLRPGAQGLDARVLPQEVRPDATTPPKRGIDSVTVPGAVPAGWRMSERFGKLPFADLLAPAIEIAERGYLVPPVVQQKWAAATPELQSLPGLRAGLPALGPRARGGRAVPLPGRGARAEAIARTKGEAFYRGEIAEALARFSAEQGGALTVQDLAAFQPEWVKPMARTTAATRCTRSRPTARASRR